MSEIYCALYPLAHFCFTEGGKFVNFQPNGTKPNIISSRPEVLEYFDINGNRIIQVNLIPGITDRCPFELVTKGTDTCRHYLGSIPVGLQNGPCIESEEMTERCPRALTAQKLGSLEARLDLAKSIQFRFKNQ
jgi:hypothetical protein